MGSVRLHLLEHDPLDFTKTNVTRWAENKGYEVKQTYVCDMQELPSVSDFDWLMVMGGSQHAWEEKIHPWLFGEKLFIADALEKGKIILGICFGAQLLAEVLGGRVFPNPYREIGWYEVSQTAEGKKSFLFRNIPETFFTFHWHSDHFSLPPGCVRLAYSQATPNQAFMCTHQPIAGVQFHPEYTIEMIKHFCREYSDDWAPDLFVSGKERVLAETEKFPDTYWLMEALLTNMHEAYVGV
jgi:GMP synthase-like glutamine amidotransferase